MMNGLAKLIACSDDDLPSEALFASKFQFTDADAGMDGFGFTSEQALENITFQVLRKPSALAVHLQRIYFCYQHNLTEDLFGALVDFLIVLEGKGQALGRRMVKGAKSKLAPQQYAILNNALKSSADEIKWLQGNLHSLFSRGLIGTSVLVIKENGTKQQEYDPLDIARDFIAYSQLNEAMDILENAILLDIERVELQHDLLELYKVTYSLERFIKMYDALSGQTNTIPSGWNELKGFFHEG